jgi:hypothetical protein
MSIDGMRDAWGPLSERIQDFYGFANSSLLQNEPFEGPQFEEVESLLEAMLADSERIRRNAERVLKTGSGEEYEAAANLLLAVASVDAMLASDLAVLDPEAGAQRREEVAEAAEETAYELGQEREQTLNRVGRLFFDEERPIGGLALANDRRQLIKTASETTTELVDLAEVPAPELLRGLLVAASGGVAEIVAAAQHVDVLADLKGSAAGVINHAPRFLREHAAKMLALRADAKVLSDVTEYLRRAVDLESVLAWISASDKANRRNEEVILAAPAISTEDAETLEAELRALVPGYREQMGLIGTSAKWLRRGASPLTHLVAPFVGHAAICGVFLIGIGYVAYSLIDRIDARDLGFADRVDGVVTLVANRVQPEPGT